jgi:formamidopyrimidine-DNA glycosylase
MPELPEIETIRRGLEETILRMPILKVDVNNASVLKTDKKRFIAALEGKELSDVRRRGKMLIFSLADRSGKADGEYLIARMGMTGRLVYFGAEDALWGSGSYADKDSFSHKHCHVALRFKNGSTLLFCDSRRFGYMEILDEKGLDVKMRGFGPEPLDGKFRARDFEKIVAGKKTNIKALLLDQKRVAGIGNIYADEILFEAGVRPDRLADGLTADETRRIHAAMKSVLKKAVEKRGTTFSDYVDSGGKEGGYQKFLKVYGRAGEKCSECGTVVRKMRLAGRGTNYCPVCQK